MVIPRICSMKHDPRCITRPIALCRFPGGCPKLSTTMAEASADAGAVHDLHHGHLHFEGGTLDALDALLKKDDSDNLDDLL